MRKFSKIVFSRAFILFLLIFLQIAFFVVINYYLSSFYSWFNIVISLLSILVFFIVVNLDVPSSIIVPWLVAIAISPIFGTTLYLLLGRNVTKKMVAKKYQRIVNDVYIDDVDYKTKNEDIKLIENLTSCKAHKNTKVEYLKCGEDFFEKLKSALRKAEKYIFMEYFIIEKGFMWNEILDVLEEKIKQGVKVFLMYDSLACSTKDSLAYFNKLKKMGINVQEFNKFTPFVDAIQNNRDHRKITVVDGKCGFMGGSNLADEYINKKKIYGLWRDSNIYIEGEAVINLIELFINQYNATVGIKESLKVEDYRFESEITDNSSYILPYGTGPYPIYEKRIAESIYLNVIYNAKEYLYITTPYLVVDTYIIDVIISAKRRGVDVKIMLPGIPDKYMVYVLAKSNFKKLIDSGVEVLLYKDGFIHSKSIVSDNVKGIVGTINFDYRSLIHHFECATYMYKAPCIIDMKEDFLNLRKENCIIAGEKEEKLGFFEKLIKNLIKAFMPLF
ncbi:MAG: cardiolipin synthase [Bacillales bacterium]|nr:cardiolipin synthase [Bacillales bacterium]